MIQTSIVLFVDGVMMGPMLDHDPNPNIPAVGDNIVFNNGMSLIKVRQRTWESSTPWVWNRVVLWCETVARRTAEEAKRNVYRGDGVRNAPWIAP